MRAQRLAVAVSLLVVALAARPGHAADKKAEAEVHYEQGKAYYKAGAFDLAIQEFLEGYKRDPRPGVLFNIARGYEELKDRAKAIEYYKKYIESGQAAAAAVTEARARMVVLERQIKEDEERKKAEAAEAERKRQEALNPPPAMPAPVETKTAGATPAAPPPAPLGASPGPGAPEGAIAVAAAPAASPDTARKLKLAGIITGGAGIVLAGAGGFFAYRASTLKSEINGEITKPDASWSPELQTKNSDMESAQTMALVGLVAGGVCVAGGAVLYYLGWNKTAHDGASQAMLTPTAGPAGSGLLLTGRF
jgi:tetratricopeptide (TPR) repeat protein